ncbi:oxidoreductase [Streptomyces californicus]
MKAMGKTRRLTALVTGGAALAAALVAPGAYAAEGRHGETASREAAVRAPLPGWKLTDTGTDSRFRGLAAVSRTTAWVAGSKGTVLRTGDGGRTWRDVSPRGAAGLELRTSRRSTEGGPSPWPSARARRPGSCAPRTAERPGPSPSATPIPRLLQLPDLLRQPARPRGGRPRWTGSSASSTTADGGRSWRVLPNAGMPAALPGEAGFAASGQCLVSSGARDVWLATGGADTARVPALRGPRADLDGEPVDPSRRATRARGVFAAAFRDRGHGLAVGGDYRPDQTSPRAAAVTGDGGRCLAAGGDPAARLPFRRRLAAVTAAPPPWPSARPAPT